MVERVIVEPGSRISTEFQHRPIEFPRQVYSQPSELKRSEVVSPKFSRPQTQGHVLNLEAAAESFKRAGNPDTSAYNPDFDLAHWMNGKLNSLTSELPQGAPNRDKILSALDKLYNDLVPPHGYFHGVELEERIPDMYPPRTKPTNSRRSLSSYFQKIKSETSNLIKRSTERSINFLRRNLSALPRRDVPNMLALSQPARGSAQERSTNFSSRDLSVPLSSNASDMTVPSKPLPEQAGFMFGFNSKPIIPLQERQAASRQSNSTLSGDDTPSRSPESIRSLTSKPLPPLPKGLSQLRDEAAQLSKIISGLEVELKLLEIRIWRSREVLFQS
ncbi:hypothetical protein [Rhizobium terrae]|uniref:hypothetical protein n=1 Tax=Rhizobium terrae TaxID=2171756 RepID=UPI0013C31FF7|nr:hypothetical protein [Rhizobium terrae]